MTDKLSDVAEIVKVSAEEGRGNKAYWKRNAVLLADGYIALEAKLSEMEEAAEFRGHKGNADSPCGGVGKCNICNALAGGDDGEQKLSEAWKALGRLRERVAEGNAADEDCNIVNETLRDCAALRKRAKRDQVEMRILWNIIKRDEEMEKHALVLVVALATEEKA